MEEINHIIDSNLKCYHDTSIVYVVGMKYIASCSFGKDSLAMVLRILEENLPLDEVVFFDTRMEFDSIYHNRDKMKRLLAEHKILFSELSSKNHFLFDMFVRPVKYKNPENKPYPIHYGYEWCGKCRWHTFIKQKICNDYTGKDNMVYVGIAVDEKKRLQNLDPYKKAPLAEWNMNEKDCLHFCYSKGIHWYEDGIELYDILDRVSCWCCQNKNLRELKNIYLYLPKYWRMLKGLQSRIDTPMKGEGKSIFQLEDRFRKEVEEKNKKDM